MQTMPRGAVRDWVKRDAFGGACGLPAQYNSTSHSGGRRIVALPELPKLMRRVRFPSPAPHRIYPFMKLTVNGKAHECPFETTVSALLEQLALTGRRVAVERNGDIVPRSQHAETVLAEGDQIEIVVAVGGG